ncbi:MAG: alpha/beta hydrolase [Natronospirillum sp.]
MCATTGYATAQAPARSVGIEDALANMHCLIVPGWQGSGADHWQTFWQNRLPSASRVQVDSWDTPNKEDWVASIDRALASVERPVLLVAHSLGCPTIAHWADTSSDQLHKVVGALLVAPADVERSAAISTLRHFGPLPRKPLPFSTLLLASDNDPTASIERANQMAGWWGSEIYNLGHVGHINPAAGFNQWEEGLAWLKLLVRRC